MIAMPKRHDDPMEIRDTQMELDRLLSKLDRTLSVLRAEIDDVQRIINEREP